MNLTIDSEFRALIPALTAEEYAGLEKSILAEGCRDALVVWNGTLVDGHNRYEICQRHNIGFQTVQKDFDSRDAAHDWIIDNQCSRRNLPQAMRISLQLKKSTYLIEQAEENHGRNGGDKKSANRISDTPIPKISVNKSVAAATKCNADTVSKVRQVEAKATPEVKQAMLSGEMSINQAYQVTRREEKAARQEEHRQENAAKVEALATPLDAQGLFQTIVIDPPWDWGDEGDMNQMGRAKPEYATMPIDEIKALPISKIADDNCHLYLWVTNRSLPKAFSLVEAWGFRYITCLTWVKPSFGMGNYFRGSTEQVIFAVKGSQPLKRHDVGTHFHAPRGEKGHSAKPDEFYKLVETCSYAPYIDVFGRKKRDGWALWGENG